MALQDDCKHENQTGVYCGVCGKALKDPDEEQIRGLVRSEIRGVLEEAGVIKKATTTTTTTTQRSGNLKDKIFNKGKK